ncbi:MAG: heme o synthase [Bernardetiaceae bacterium]|nr:heme o synthase [Bernardetiaceae bacterium]
MQAEPLAITSTSDKLRQYTALLKLRLSSLVVFSGGIGFALASPGPIDWVKLWLLCLGSLLITGAANAINQVLERETDKLMKRTASRPLPTARVQVTEALWVVATLVMVGSLVLALGVNLMAAVLSLISLLIYAFVYTPLKTRSSVAVFVGAIPGAMPPLIGWAAQTGELGLAAWILFAVQFIWQFPHFWAIAWVADEDYRNAGIRLLPSNGERDFSSAFTIMSYTLFLLPIGLLPFQFGLAGLVSGLVATGAGLVFLAQSVYLLKAQTVKAAKGLMFGSFLYLPIVQIAYLLDKM